MKVLSPGYAWATSRTRANIPTSLVGEAVTQGPHVVTDGRPFGPTDDANVLDGKDGEEEVLIGSVVPILVHLAKACPFPERPGERRYQFVGLAMR